MKLTEVKIKTFKIPKKETFHSDGNGLYLRLRPNGTKSWIFRYNLDRKSYKIGLGIYPAISLKAVRKKAFLLQEDITAGNNPKIEKEKQKDAATNTFGAIESDWYQVKSHAWSENYCKKVRSLMESYALPPLRERDIKRETPPRAWGKLTSA